MSKLNNSPEEILEVINDSSNVVVCMDSRFDFDSYCSVLSIKKFLSELEKTCDIYYDGTLPERAQKIYPQSFIIENTNPNNINFEKYDLLFFLDSGTLNHVQKEGLFEHPKTLKSICIDHHNSNPLFGTLNYVFPSEASTTDVLYKFFKALNIEIDIEMATYLLTGIMTDTGFFQFINTKPKDLRTAAELWERGVDVEKIIFDLTNQVTMKDVMIQKMVLNNFEVDTQKKVAYVVVTVEDLEEHGLTYEEFTYPVSDILKKIENIDFAFSIKEIKDTPNLYNVSFRAHSRDYDVSKLAQKFGGGGHKAAAGANIEGKSPQEIIDKIYSILV